MKVKSLSILGLLVGCLVGLTACGQSESSKETSPEEIAFAKVAKMDEQNVWFLIEGDKTAKTPISQDARIDSVIVTKAGKYKMFKTGTGKLTLANISTMDNAEIINNAEKFDQDRFDNKLKTDSDDYNSILQSAQDELKVEKGREFADQNKIKDLEEKIPLLENDIENLKSIAYQLPIWKDISVEIIKGNDGEEPKSENISFSYTYLSSPIWNFSSFNELSSEGDKVEIIENSKKVELAVPVAPAEVNKKTFTGYTNQNMETILVKQIKNSNQKMILDKE